MELLTRLNAMLSRWAMYLACVSLVMLLGIVIYGVVLRYAFNDAPAYVEQLALLLVISVSMMGASAGVRDSGHIGLDSLVRILPAKVQFWCHMAVQLLVLCFALTLCIGGFLMAQSTYASTIPTLGISEMVRYVPVLIAGVLISLFSVEQMVARSTQKDVIPSWH